MSYIAKGESIGGIYHVINSDNMKVQVFDDAEWREKTAKTPWALFDTQCMRKTKNEKRG